MPEALPPSSDDDLFLVGDGGVSGPLYGTSWMHTESDLRLFFAWCAEQHLAPLAAQRGALDLPGTAATRYRPLSDLVCGRGAECRRACP